MNTSKLNYFYVGGFVLAVLVLFLVTIALVTGRTGATDTYYAVFRNVSGLKFGSQVVFEGYGIGQVEKITPMPEAGGMRFRVDLSVTRDWRIPDDSIAQITASGLLAAITVNVSAGQSARALNPGNEIKAREASNLFAVMSSVASDVGDLTQTSIKPLLATLNDLAVTDIKPLLAALGRTADTFGNVLEKDMIALIEEMRALVLDMSVRIPKITGDVEEFTGKMNRASDELNAMLSPQNRKSIEQALASLEKTMAGLDRLLVSANGLVGDNKDDIEKVIKDLRHVAETVARDIDSVNQNMEGTARNMYEFSRQIRQNPGLLLGGQPPRDTAVR